MSYQNGLAAINLEMPGIVPRTEYSAHMHRDLVLRVTGIDIAGADQATKQRATSAFIKAWDYGMYWNVLTHSHVFGDKRTRMGHAVFAADGSDFTDQISALFAEPEDVYAFDMFENFGKRDKSLLTAQYDADYDRQRALYPDTVAMTGIYITCVSGLIELLGWDTLLCAAGIDAAKFGAFTNRYCDWILQYFEALAASKAPVVMVHDDIVWGNGPFLAPEFYRTFVFNNYHRLLRPLLDAGKKIIYTADGNFTAFIDDIAACGVHALVMEPGTDMALAAERYGNKLALIGNADTSKLLFGTRADIETEVRRCMDIGKKCPGFMMAVGNHIPPNTPVENALWYDECYRKYARR